MQRGSSWASEDDELEADPEAVAAGDDSEAEPAAGAAEPPARAAARPARRPERGTRAGSVAQARRSRRREGLSPSPPAAPRAPAVAERRVLAAPVRMSPSIDKVETAHRAARLLQGAERQAWLAARKGAGSKADIKPMLLAPSDQIEVFMAVLELINKLADAIAAERLVDSNEDLAENRILTAFGDAALATARAAFVGLAPSDDQSCRTALALRALLVAYLPPRAANSWNQLHRAWTWPGSFALAFSQAVRLMELRNEISGLTMGSPFLAKRLTPWTVPDLLTFLVNRGPPWVAQALYSTQATMLPELKAAMSALDPGTDNVSTGFLAALALEHIRCFHCNKFGHRRPECPLYKAGMPAIPLGSEAPAGASGASFVSDRIGRAEGDAPYTRPGVNALSGVTPEYVAHLEQAYVQAQLEQVTDARRSASGRSLAALGGGPLMGAEALAALRAEEQRLSEESARNLIDFWQRPRFIDPGPMNYVGALPVRHAPPLDHRDSLTPTPEELHAHRNGSPMRTQPMPPP